MACLLFVSPGIGATVLYLNSESAITVMANFYITSHFSGILGAGIIRRKEKELANDLPDFLFPKSVDYRAFSRVGIANESHYEEFGVSFPSS